MPQSGDEVELAEEHSPESIPRGDGGTGWRKLRRISGILTHFLVGQGALFLVNMLAELFLVRKLSLESYAQFSVAYAFQATVRILMDFGFSSTIIPLVGERHHDRALVGRYVRAARRLRNRTFLFITPFASVAFLAIVHKHHWSYRSQLGLLASVLLSLYASGSISYYAAPLLLHGRLREYYLPQTLAAALRLAAYAFLRALNSLSATVAAGLNALGILAASIMLKKKAKECVEWPTVENAEAEREIVKYILPAAPAIIFSAFQTQISLFLISIFGQTSSVAEVAALGRIGQLFTMMTTFNIVIVEPYVARLSRTRLISVYVKFILIACGACALLVLTAFRVPGLFVWFLGAKYQDLRGVIGWAMVAGSIGFIAGLIWIMNRARKWIFWSGAWMEVVLVLAMQVWFLEYVDVRTTWHAVLFMLASSVCVLIAHCYVAVLGFLQQTPAASDLSSLVDSVVRSGERGGTKENLKVDV